MLGYLGEFGDDGRGADLQRVELGVDSSEERLFDAGNPVEILPGRVIVIEFVRGYEEITPAETEYVQKRLCHGVEGRITSQVRPPARKLIFGAYVIELAADEFEDCSNDMRLYMDASCNETRKVGGGRLSKDRGAT